MKHILSISTALTVISTFVGIGSAIWIIAKGDWLFVIYGIGLAAICPIMLTTLSMPSTLIFFLATSLAKKGHVVSASILSFISSFLTSIIVIFWCFSILFFFTLKSSVDTYIPMLAFAYVVAISPLVSMSAKEAAAGNVSSAVSITYTHIGLLLSVFGIYLFQMPIFFVLLILLFFEAIGMLSNYIIQPNHRNI